MPKVFCISNQKGGSGKTTIAITLASHFAMKGIKTLLIDTDSQGHDALCLGKSRSDGLYHLIVNHEPLNQVCVETRKDLFLIPNDKSSISVQQYLWAHPGRINSLHKILTEATNFKVVIIDTSPSIEFLQILSLVASDFLLIPTRMDFCSIDGVGQMLTTLQGLKQYSEVTPPRLVGVIPFQYDQSTAETKKNLSELSRTLGYELILPPIPSDTLAREATAHGQTIWEYAPKCRAIMGIAVKTNSGTIQHIGGYNHLVQHLYPYIDQEMVL